MNYKSILFFLIGLILFIHLTNRVIETMIKDTNSNILSSRPFKISPKPARKDQTRIVPNHKAPRKHPLVPDDPGKYGIISVNGAEMPRTQLQWDLFMEKAVLKTKILEVPRAREAIDLMKKSPADFTKREEELTSRIELFEKTLESNPNDEDLNHRLQTLYMLKALGKVLKGKVVSGEIPINAQENRLQR